MIRWFALLLLVLGPLPARAQTPPARSSELNLQFFRAETAWKSGSSLLEAKARVDRVLKALPNDVPALKLRAQVLLGLERPAEALVDARRAAQLAPQDGEAHVILSEAALAAGDRSLALSALDVAAGLALDDAPLHARLSWTAVQLGVLDKAEAFARIALALSPADGAGYYQLARVFVLRNQPDEAALVLARGFRAQLLEPDLVRDDPVLQRLQGHAELATWLGDT